MRTVLHAVALVLTVLLLLIRPRYTFAAVCYKRIATPFSSCGHGNFNATANLARDGYFFDPKYKRDPEIEADDEKIGSQPLE